MPYQDVVRRLGLYDLLEPAYSRGQMLKWLRAGQPSPPPSAVKRRIIVEYAARHGITTLVETGTYRADTVRALRGKFERIVSIELLEEAHVRAVARCRYQRNAELLLGDSGVVLPAILSSLDRPGLFWLDAHYSGTGTASPLEGEATPIERELEAILNHEVTGHVILIDDARAFHASAATGYPPTSVLQTVATRHGYVFSEAADIFRLVPDHAQ